MSKIPFRTFHAMLALAAVLISNGFLLSPPASAQGINDSAIVSWVASEDTDGNSEWESTDDTYSWDLGSDQAIATGITNLGGVRAWYAAPRGMAVALDSLGFSTAEVSLEIVFSPGSYEGDYVLLESGGNLDGTAFVLQQGVLEYRVQDANSDDQRVILSHALPENGEADFYHAVATVLPGVGDENEVVLYVDGEEVGRESAFGDLLDWSGDNGAGLGVLNGAISTGQAGFDDFPGGVAEVHLYDFILESADIAAEFESLKNVEDDTDEDGLSDFFENFFFGNLDETPEGDPDGDTLTNLVEQEQGTSPAKADTDGDGLADNVETKTGTWVSASDTGTDPLDADSDDDELVDGVETNSGTFVDASETGTDPLSRDTDGDGVSDSFEIANASDPTDRNSLPGGALPEPTEVLKSLGALPTYDGRNTDGGSNWDSLDASFLVEIDFEQKEDGNRELIWETGAATIGWSVTYEAGSKLVSRKSGNAGLDVATVEYALTEADLAAGELLIGWTFQQENDDFEQVISLIVGDRIVASQAGDFQADWTGSDPGAFGVASTNVAAAGGNAAISADAFESGTINLVNGLRFYADLLFVPESPDSDGDGLPDSWETVVGLDPAVSNADEDPDTDGLTNLQEFTNNTLPLKADTDADGVSDGAEIADGSDPLVADSDADGLNDGEEKAAGTDPNKRDTDGDTAPDGWELAIGSDPTKASSPGAVLLNDFGEPEFVLNETGLTDAFEGAVTGGGTLDGIFRVCIDFDEKLDGTREVIFESGAALIGTSLCYEAGNKLVARTVGKAGLSLAVVSHTLTQEQLDAGALEVLVSYDVENDDLEQTFALWINGFQMGAVSKDLGGDWSGDNEASFGAASTSVTGTGSNGTLSGDDFTSGTIDLAKGLQLFTEILPEVVSIGAGSAFVISAITRDSTTGQVTITWNSIPDSSYSLDVSSDLTEWQESEDGIASGGATTSFADSSVSDEKTIYFRVREE